MTIRARLLLITSAFLTMAGGMGILCPLNNLAFAGVYFGAQGSISGDTYLVGQRFGDVPPGSSGDVGSVHVFVRENVTSWPETTTLESVLDSGSLSIGAEFGGGAVLLDGDTAIVGAYRNTVGEASQAGNVFVFTRSDSTWTEQAVLEMPGGAVENARFGAAGDIDSNRLILSSSGSGKAYIFSRTEQTWDSGVELVGGTIGTPIGVAIDGNLAAVGNYVGDPHVDLWRYNEGSGMWDFETAISNPSTAADNLLGTAIDIHGNTMLVSARQEAVGDTIRAGVVYAYEYADETWTLQQTIENPNPAASDLFGYDVAIDGNRLAIGAPRDDAGANDAGVAYFYERQSTGSDWIIQETYSAETPEVGKWFGEFVDVSGDVLLAGGSGRTTEVDDPEPETPDPGNGDAYWFDLDETPQPPQHPGDANRDGTVDADDAQRLAENWRTEAVAEWEHGDFNGDNMVNDIDATIMTANWGWIWTAPLVAVPEPCAIVLLTGLACVGLFWRLKK